MKPQLLLWCQQRSAQVFHREQRVQIPLPLVRHVHTKLTQRLKLGTFSFDNVTFKMNWRFYQLCHVYFSSLKIANVGEFPWS